MGWSQSTPNIAGKIISGIYQFMLFSLCVAVLGVLLLLLMSSFGAIKEKKTTKDTVAVITIPTDEEMLKD